MLQQQRKPPSFPQPNHHHNLTQQRHKTLLQRIHHHLFPIRPLQSPSDRLITLHPIIPPIRLLLRLPLTLLPKKVTIAAQKKLSDQPFIGGEEVLGPKRIMWSDEAGQCGEQVGVEGGAGGGSGGRDENVFLEEWGQKGEGGKGNVWEKSRKAGEIEGS